MAESAVMESINREPPSQNTASTAGEVARPSSPPPPVVVMHPPLLLAARRSDCEALKALLLSWGDPPVGPSPESQQFVVEVSTGSPTTDAGRPNRDDVGIGTNDRTSATQHEAEQLAVQPAASSAKLLLEGVTPQGDTALHLVAKSGSSGESILDCTYVICSKAKHLIDMPNAKGDTPLHCAVRTGNRGMVSYLVDLAKREQDGGEKVKAMLRKQNMSGETALHEAIRAGNEDIVVLLLTEDPELARIPDEGASPLYLAIVLKQINIAQKLYDKDNHLSYSGQDGRNALHAAAIAGKVLTKKVLQWNKGLTALRDDKGSTPLHFAAALPGDNHLAAALLWGKRGGSVCSQIFEANTDALYEPDKDGLFPIHIAASVGEQGTIAMFIEKCHSSAGLCDTKGRTFLHVAVEKKKVGVVSYACRNRRLRWILNMQDNDGNTALHLAVKAGSLRLFSPLFGRQEVNLNLTNAEGQTPLDISRYKLPPGLSYNQNSEVRIHHALNVAGATSGASRRDHFRQKYKDIHGMKSSSSIGKKESKSEIEEFDKMKDSLCIGSVLIATVTFSAAFALPGGYRQDDHPKGGTPTFSGRFAFDAFMIANTLAFIFSSMATVCLMRSGSPLFNRLSRTVYLNIAFYSVETSVTCLISAFALCVYAVLSSVARKTAIAICVMSPFVVVCIKAEFWLKWAILARPLFIRMGPIWTLGVYTRVVVGNMLIGFWPYILIFIWAAYGRGHPTSKLEPPAQPPAPLT